MANQPCYDRIGIGYDVTRRADPYLTRRLLGLLEPRSGGLYLDVACGSGNYTAALAAEGLALCGVDQSATMIAAARRKSPEVRWHIGDVEALPFADGSFDGACCTLAIHHFERLTTAFKEVRRVLRRGRWVIFTATREQMRGYWLNAYFPTAMARAIAQMPDLPDVDAALRGAGFRLIRSEAYEVQPNLQDFFLYSGKYRPDVYLKPEVRHGISTFALFGDPEEIETGCKKLAGDISTGRFDNVARSFVHSLGDYMFVVAGADGLP